MERESTKHGRRLDEELRHETASVVQGAPVPAQSREDRRQEDPDEGLEVEMGTRPDIPAGGPVDDEEAIARAELARAVAPAHFPARRRELIEAATASGADERVLTELGSLPSGQELQNVQAIWDALGGHREESARPHRRQDRGQDRRQDRRQGG